MGPSAWQALRYASRSVKLATKDMLTGLYSFRFAKGNSRGSQRALDTAVTTEQTRHELLVR